MDKIKLGVIFGGMSTEHDVSIVSGTSVISNLNKDKYEVFPIYINKQGDWYKYEDINKSYQVGDEVDNITKIDNPTLYLKSLDVVFPVLHGLYGEDGSIQGLLELLKIPYVGCHVLSSSISMDKAYTKIIFEKAGIKQANYIYLKVSKNNCILIHKDFSEEIVTLDKVCEIAESLKYPIFVKPSNSGSSVGIRKASSREELKEAINYASQFDNKVLLEEQINGREIECAVLGNEDVKASCLGEILPSDSFYSFDAKYKDENSKTIVSAELKGNLEEKVKELAIKAFKAVDGKGFSRVDFFVNEQEEQIYINEINTIPGFTKISMYPKLWEHSDIPYPELLDNLIFLAMK